MPQVAVVKAEWHFIDEKLEGIVHQVVAHRKQYSVCKRHIKDILGVLLHMYELMRQSVRSLKGSAALLCL